MKAEIKDNLPEMLGKMRGKNVEVLRDSECKGVIVKSKYEAGYFWRSVSHDDGEWNARKSSYCQNESGYSI